MFHPPVRKWAAACALIGTAGTEQVLLTDGHDHTHDPATKNALSRGGDVSAATSDPTTAR